MIALLYRYAWALARPLASFAPGRGKLARTARGRAQGARRLVAWAREHRTRAPLVWFHAASVGEGRQAEAVLTRLRSQRETWQVVYTFASASAESFAASLPADYAGYIPADTPGETGAALDAVRPSALVFSATDLWPELVRQARLRAVRTALISATLAPASSRRGRLARALLTPAYVALDAVGAIDPKDASDLAALGVKAERVRVTGDTRHDSAAARAAGLDRALPALRALTGPAGQAFQSPIPNPESPLLLAGSTWPSDETVLLEAVAEARRQTPLRLVIAPHEPSQPRLAALEARVRSRLGEARVVRLGELERATGSRTEAPPDWDVCLVDRVGVLADLYAAAGVAYVGGGFHRAGLHAVIEPAAHGVPVLFGPRWRGSRDARLLIEAGGGRSVGDSSSLASALHLWLTDDDSRAAAAAAARKVVEAGIGAAERSVELVIGLVEKR